MARILVLEDDLLLGKTLCYNLESDGYATALATDQQQAMELLEGEPFDLAVLDVNLPDGSGYDVCKRLREQGNTPVIFLTANDMESDMLKGYELGADDYVTKPFSIGVFGRKVAALLRRAQRPASDCYADGRLTVDFDAATACIDGRELALTPLELRMLKIFAANPGRVLTRQVLLERLWDAGGNFVDEHALTSSVSRLRGKIESGHHRYIKTVYGMGYLWAGEKR